MVSGGVLFFCFLFFVVFVFKNDKVLSGVAKYASWLGAPQCMAMSPDDVMDPKWINVILTGSGDCPWTLACLEYCKWRDILKKKVLWLTPVWSGLVCFLGGFQLFRYCLHSSLESILPVTSTDLPHLTAYTTHLHPFLMKTYMGWKALMLEMEGCEQQVQKCFKMLFNSCMTKKKCLFLKKKKKKKFIWIIGMPLNTYVSFTVV